MAPHPKPLSVRLAALTDRRGPDECWPFTGTINKDLGYGTLREAGTRKALYAHRVACEVAHGPIPPGYQVAHLCHVRSCVNPAHLRAVPHRENIQQTVAARNHAGVILPGESNPAAKLTREQVDTLRALFTAWRDAVARGKAAGLVGGEVSRYFSSEPWRAYRAFVATLGISDTTLHRVLSGETWVKGDDPDSWHAS